MDAQESPDGGVLFFKKGNGLWRRPLRGGMPAGPESQVLDSVDKYNFQIEPDGIYFIAPPVAGTHAICYYDFASRGIRTIATTSRRATYGFSVSPDRRAILYAQFDESVSDLMLIENFR